jgi:hypothetical protein
MTCPDKNVRSSRLPGEASPLAGPSHGGGLRFRQAVCCDTSQHAWQGRRFALPLHPSRPHRARENDSAQKPRRWRRSAVSVSRAEFPADRTSPTPRLSGEGEAAILDQRSMRLGGSTRQKRRCTIDSGSTRRKWRCCRRYRHFHRCPGLHRQKWRGDARELTSPETTRAADPD